MSYPSLSAPVPVVHILLQEPMENQCSSEKGSLSETEMHTSNKQIRTVENESDFQTPQTESKSLACMVFPIVQPNFSMRPSLEFDWNNQIFGENVWANPF